MLMKLKLNGPPGSLRNEAGVAAITVLLIVAVVGTLGASLLFTVNEDLGFVRTDSASERALDIAEGGLDLAAEYLFQNTIPAGASSSNPLTFSSTIADAGQNESGTISMYIASNNFPVLKVAVTSDANVGRSGTTPVTRRLKQTMTVTILDIPFGMFINGDVNFGGTPKLRNASMLVKGSVDSREKLNFDVNGDNKLNDVDMGWVYHSKFVTATAVGTSPAIEMAADGAFGKCILPSGHPGAGQAASCSAVYATGSIRNTGGANPEVHSTSTDPRIACTYQNAGCAADRDLHQNTKLSFPSDPLANVIGRLRQISQEQGLYVDVRGGGADNVNCDAGTSQPKCPWSSDAGGGAGHKHYPTNLVFFFDADVNDSIRMNSNLIPGDEHGGSAPDCDFFQLKTPEVCAESGLIIVLGGSLEFQSVTWSGAAYVPSGKLRMAGNANFTGTIFSNAIEFSGGTNSLQLTPEWFGRLPTGFRKVVRTDFLECESFQDC